ncbi:SDR family NAD(P)-dependent oxidoreductase [Colwellia psychrerythraea]|jgi:NAD(P)-dependent dehydrogenase (short-subunit alcohol dehydrogenase family)|uniref:Oxidoreductase, short chain dehydrogenase/reductase family n=1 Tax=Colwellia psychrerythraea (strain 34H / ATCC BAA-681) TaxID=167879 RepID=Q47XS6_COLP3|nr:SDR family NAD(P)-dependent oxidoreductase [Colwellia psychrerythraea]AAZ24403.1 oxidoreductase, short chain dehydrogenase/reductase family [Colwellia psychrerythraea 34H]
MKPLFGKVALVTGASRGIGKGIALSLGEAGAKVYITGRTVEEGKSASCLSGTIHQTVEEVIKLGGECVAIQCDHSIDSEVEAAFNRINAENKRLNILVNNVWGGYEHYTDGTEFWHENGFWTVPISRWDAMFHSGVRANYISSVLAVPLLMQQEDSLIITLSFFAAQRNDKGVAYGTAKAASDHMVACMAEELREHNIAAVSLYPGLVRTESVMKAAKHLDLSNSESPQFIGRAVVALASDTDIMKKSGRVLVAAKLAQEYGFTDINGEQPRPLTAQDV